VNTDVLEKATYQIKTHISYRDCQ